MSKVTWVGPGVFGNDVLPGQPLPEGVDPATVKRLIAAGKAVVGDLPAQAVVNDELAAVKQELTASQQRVSDLTEQLTAAQTAISELTDQLMAGTQATGPKKEKPK